MVQRELPFKFGVFLVLVYSCSNADTSRTSPITTYAITKHCMTHAQILAVHHQHFKMWLVQDTQNVY